MLRSFRRLQKAANVVAGGQSVGKTQCPEVAVQASAKTLRNSVDDASTLKPSYRRGSRSLQEAEQSCGCEARAQRRWAENFATQHLSKGCQE